MHIASFCAQRSGIICFATYECTNLCTVCVCCPNPSTVPKSAHGSKTPCNSHQPHRGTAQASVLASTQLSTGHVSAGSCQTSAVTRDVTPYPGLHPYIAATVPVRHAVPAVAVRMLCLLWLMWLRSQASSTHAPACSPAHSAAAARMPALRIDLKQTKIKLNRIELT